MVTADWSLGLPTLGLEMSLDWELVGLLPTEGGAYKSPLGAFRARGSSTLSGYIKQSLIHFPFLVSFTV